jgi:organic radical activating enzyme
LNVRIQIETNGTIFRDIPKTVEIVCSPKNTGRGYFRIREDLLARITAVKFIISKTNLLYQNVSDIGQLDYKIPVYIQPMDEYNDEKNKLNMEYAINLTLEHGYRLSVQMHKYIGVK